MARITDALPPPKYCDNCNSYRVKLYRNTRRHRAKYVCLECNASVYCHKYTTVPLGYMATGKTRYMRAAAHEAFDPLWQHGLMTRDEAYEWLARQLGLTRDLTHIGRLSNAQLDAVARKAPRFYRKLKSRLNKQKAIQHATDRRQRTYSRQRKRGGKWKPNG